eukprot:1160292-Pelagomonas_calceolata.AAC.6
MRSRAGKQVCFFKILLVNTSQAGKQVTSETRPMASLALMTFVGNHITSSKFFLDTQDAKEALCSFTSPTAIV